MKRSRTADGDAARVDAPLEGVLHEVASGALAVVERRRERVFGREPVVDSGRHDAERASDRSHRVIERFWRAEVDGT